MGVGDYPRRKAFQPVRRYRFSGVNQENAEHRSPLFAAEIDDFCSVEGFDGPQQTKLHALRAYAGGLSRVSQ
jgi:hypothetical protein